MRALLVVCVAACGATGADIDGTRWQAADRLFHQDPDWLGGDGAITVDLGGDRTLWLFGDTFLATTPEHTRRASVVVHDSIAVMTGRDPLTATMAHAWARGPTPGPFFGGDWLRPTAGVRAPTGELLVFATELRSAGLGVATTGARVLRVADPGGPADAWAIDTIPLAIAIGCAVRDDDWLVGVAGGRMVRWPIARAASGDFTGATWWDGATWSDRPAARVLPDDLQCTLRYEPALALWTYLATGAGAIDMRASQALTGPYDDPGHAYAGDAQLASAAGHDLAPLSATFVERSDSFDELLERQDELWWPELVRLDVEHADE